MPAGTDDDTYDMETDGKGRSIMNLWRLGKFGVFDPASEQFASLSHADARLRTAARRDRRARPRVGDAVLGRPRGDVRPRNARDQGVPSIPGTAPYTPPFPSPYSLAVDDKNQIVWTNDFNSSRIYRLDARTGALDGIPDAGAV